MSKTFDQAVEGAWSTYEHQLTNELERIGEQSFSIDVPAESEGDGASPYLQFAGSGDVVRAEVSSNTFLDVACRLDEDAEDLLRVLGWQEPDEENPNWWYDAPRDLVEVLLPMVIETFRYVFGVVHPAMLESDRLRAVPTQAGPSESGDGALPAGRPADRDELTAMVEATLGTRYQPEVIRDDDGDFPIHTGVAPLWVQARPDAPVVRLFSFLVVRVRDKRQAHLEVGILNRRSKLVRFHVDGDVIVAAYDLPAAPFSGEQLLHVLDEVCETVNSIAADTAVRVRGKLWFEDLAQRRKEIGDSA